MNKEYTYIDGKIIIRDENGNQIQTEYYDNIDKILIRENIIETIENEIQGLEIKNKRYKDNTKKHFIPTVIPLTALASIVGIPLFSLIYGDASIFTTTVDTIFGPMNEVILNSITIAICMLPAAIAGDFALYQLYKITKRKEKGTKSELDFLKKQLLKEKEQLKNLQTEKTKENENTEFRTVEIDDLEDLRVLDYYKYIYYDLGYYEEEYNRCYNEGTLEQKLRDSHFYNDAAIELAHTYLEDKPKVKTIGRIK